MKTRSLLQMKLIGIAAIVMLLAASCTGITSLYSPTAPPTLVPTPTPTEVPSGLPPTIGLPLAGADIVYIPGGTFLMGSQKEDPNAKLDELPMHRVMLKAYYIMTKEVTNEAYLSCVKSGGCTPPKNNKQYEDPAFATDPIVGINWEQAKFFCNAIGGELPTEAEWEKAARGFTGQEYPWGNTDPTCDKANTEGCTGAPDPVDSHDAGASPFGVLNSIGNIAEWTLDGYSADFYSKGGFDAPINIDITKGVVVRGGNFEEMAFTAANRSSADPNKSFENIGFRCLVHPNPTATICRNTYIPFCRPPDQNNGGCEEGVPPETIVPNPEIPNPNCDPNGGLTFTVNLNLASAEGFFVSINGNLADCAPSATQAGSLDCTIINPGGGEVDVSICNGSPEPTAPLSFIEPVDFNSVLAAARATVAAPRSSIYTFSPQVATIIQNNPDEVCPDGYIWNPDKGQCERDPNVPNDCPPNYTTAYATGDCQPTTEGDCPPGTTYAANLQGCQPPDNGDCPQGTIRTDNGTCIPSINRDPFCPRGYYFNRLSNCCVSIPRDNWGCPQGTIFNPRNQNCVQTNQDGCPYGYIYDPYTGCVPDYGNNNPGTYDPGNDYPNNNGCPPGTAPTTATAAVICEPTGEQGGNQTDGCPQGYHRDVTGACIPDNQGTQPDCGPNATFVANLDNCTTNDDDGCPPNSSMNRQTNLCEPDTGPRSPCPVGYTFSRRLRCCVPNPGTDGSNCPGDSTNGTPPTNQTTPAGVAPAPDYTSPNYNPFTGNCDPTDGTEPCLPGYHTNYFGQCEPNDTPGQSPCQTGYHMNDAGVCIPDTSTGTNGDCPPNTTTAILYTDTCTPDTVGDCPPGQTPGVATFVYDNSVNGCVPTSDGNPNDQCRPDQYFDANLGYCVQRNPDCCRIGYRYDSQRKICVPLVDILYDPNNPDASRCPQGWWLDDQMCVHAPTECYNFMMKLPTTCVQTNCPPGQYFNYDLNGCIANCPAGARFDAVNQTCICSNEQQYFAATNTCGQPFDCGTQYGRDQTGCQGDSRCRWDTPNKYCFNR